MNKIKSALVAIGIALSFQAHSQIITPDVATRALTYRPWLHTQNTNGEIIVCPKITYSLNGNASCVTDDKESWVPINKIQISDYQLVGFEYKPADSRLLLVLYFKLAQVK